MIVEGTFVFDAPREAVWDLLQDPAVLAKALPGATELVQSGDDVYQGKMHVGVGPVSAGAFAVTVTIADKVAPERYAMTVDGKGGIGFTRGTAQVELREDDNKTVMRYRADLQIGGKIAGVGQRLLDSASRTMTRQGLEAMNRELQARLHGASPAGAAAKRVSRPSGKWVAAVLLGTVAILFAFCGPA